jgi:mono/diheme cytochrome c family protein
VRGRTLGLLAAVALAACAGAAAAKDKLSVEHGRQVFQYWCATCHGAGPGHPGTDALQAKYGGKTPALLEDRRDLTPNTVSFYVRRGVSIMPFFRKTEISDADLDDLGAYLARKKR